MMKLRRCELSFLDYMAAKTGFMYVSDLSLDESLIYIQHVLRDIESQSYSLKEWNDAVEYITREKAEFETGEQAKQYLLALSK